jgi:hypothetical protein
MEEYRVDYISTNDFERYLNEAASGGWTLAAVAGLGDNTQGAWIFLRRSR